MGGKAFGHPPHSLITPRIPQNLYTTLLDHFISLLSSFYATVASPIDVPEKPTHGDIDILVSGPYSVTNPQAISHAFDAKAVVTTPGSPSTSFAVPFPNSPDRYIQVDVHVCPASTFQWELFTNSHGDLWNILGTSIRGFGLTANNIGLYLRIAEIEHIDRKKSMIFLTSDPMSVLDLLGLNEQMYWRQFGTVDEMYEYALSMRFFKEERYVREDLKANDRKRMRQRPIYSRFVSEWLPQRLRRDDVHHDPDLTRECVLGELLERYGKSEEYEKTLQEWRAERKELEEKQQYKEQRRAAAKGAREYADAWIGASLLARPNQSQSEK
ncbi:hypothetical protein MMC13_002215 [Lambiella insularis]|nr:hypothetical protein [Lambiella insularis]